MERTLHGLTLQGTLDLRRTAARLPPGSEVSDLGTHPDPACWTLCSGHGLKGTNSCPGALEHGIACPNTHSDIPTRCNGLGAQRSRTDELQGGIVGDSA